MGWFVDVVDTNHLTQRSSPGATCNPVRLTVRLVLFALLVPLRSLYVELVTMGVKLVWVTQVPLLRLVALVCVARARVVITFVRAVEDEYCSTLKATVQPSMILPVLLRRRIPI